MDINALLETKRASKVRFPAAEPLYRAARLRAAQACAAYNSQAEIASPERRAELWQEIINRQRQSHPAVPSDAVDRPAKLEEPVTANGELGEYKLLSRPNFEATMPPPASGREAADAGNSNLSPSASSPHIAHRSDNARLGPNRSNRTEREPQSPPPSPECVHNILSPLPPACALAAEPLVEAALADTPPPSRKPSTPLFRIPLGDSQETIQSESDPATTNPFIVEAPYIKPPLWIDYGTNLDIAPTTFINRNFFCMDSPVCRVRVGERCLLGPNITLAAVEHPMDASERRGPLGAPSLASNIKIGDDCWLGSGVMVLCGVKIGAGCTIGAGSVVTRDVAPGYFAAGNPARHIRICSPSYVDPEVYVDTSYSDSREYRSVFDPSQWPSWAVPYPNGPPYTLASYFNVGCWKDAALVVLSFAGLFAFWKNHRLAMAV